MHNKKAPRMEIGREIKVVHLPTISPSWDKENFVQV